MYYIVCMCVYIYIYIYIYVHTYTYTCIHMYICIYIYIHTYTHTHTHVFKQPRELATHRGLSVRGRNQQPCNMLRTLRTHKHTILFINVEINIIYSVVQEYSVILLNNIVNNNSVGQTNIPCINVEIHNLATHRGLLFQC